MKTLPVVMLGTGLAGRALVRRILARDYWWAGREGFSFKLCALVDSASALAGQPLLDEAAINAALSRKELGQPLDSGLAAARWLEVLPTDKPAIVVDATRSPDTGPNLLEAVRRGHSVVLLNDAPLLGSPALFRTLTADRRTRFEVTVGAGLPIIEPLEHLLDAGAAPTRIEATLNPTLAACFAAMESDSTSSEAARIASVKLLAAIENESVTGQRALRQALILSRCLGSDLRMESICVEQLGRRGDAPDGERLMTWMAEARRAGRTLRHVAQITRHNVSVGIREVPVSSPLACPRGGTAVVVWGARHEPLLAVHGSGEGAEHSAIAALGDMLVLAREEDKPWRLDRLERNRPFSE
jgi:homoserine dehydrogenase